MPRHVHDSFPGKFLSIPIGRPAHRHGSLGLLENDATFKAQCISTTLLSIKTIDLNTVGRISFLCPMINNSKKVLYFLGSKVGALGGDLPFKILW